MDYIEESGEFTPEMMENLKARSKDFPSKNMAIIQTGYGPSIFAASLMTNNPASPDYVEGSRPEEPADGQIIGEVFTAKERYGQSTSGKQGDHFGGLGEGHSRSRVPER